MTKTEKFCATVILIIGATFFLSGCGYQPSINAGEKVIADAIDKGADQDYSVKKFALCHTPYATVLAHPGDFGWLNKACSPGSSSATPDTLLTGKTGAEAK